MARRWLVGGAFGLLTLLVSVESSPVALVLRGGSAPAADEASLTGYADELAEFMTTFDTLLERASSTCKRSALGFSASAARVRPMRPRCSPRCWRR